MKSPICGSKICVTNRKQTASFRIAGLMLAIAPLWLMLATSNISAHAQTSSPSPADWTQFHRDNMQRWNPYETVLGVNNVASLQLMWQSGCCGTDFGLPGLRSPAVANGVVYVGSWGDFDSNVYALNASTGAKLWSYTTGGQLVSSPAVANGVVYIGSGDSNVYALHASTGAKLWSYTTGAGVESSPAVANGVVYVGYDDDNLYALNASTGAKLWSFATGGGSECIFGVPQPPGFLNAPCKIFSSPAVANGVVYVSSTDGNLYALNASTGAKLWSNPAVSYSSPAVANGVVYIGSTALNANTGAVLWGFNTGDNAGDDIFTSSPAVANGVVYIATENGNMFALNASTGAQLWTYPAGDASP